MPSNPQTKPQTPRSREGPPLYVPNLLGLPQFRIVRSGGLSWRRRFATEGVTTRDLRSNSSRPSIVAVIHSKELTVVGAATICLSIGVLSDAVPFMRGNLYRSCVEKRVSAGNYCDRLSVPFMRGQHVVFHRLINRLVLSRFSRSMTHVRRRRQ